MAKLSLFFFIDALGWEVLKKQSGFLSGITRDKKPLETILGYSSACDPSIISGLLPEQHGHWSSFYYSPHTCPYKWTRYLRFLPSILTDSSRVRSRLSRMIAQASGFTGYFQIYNIPFSVLPYFDYAEKKWMWGTKEGLIQGKTIFDHLLERQIPFYVNPSASTTEEEQWTAVRQKIKAREIRFSYLLLGKLDHAMHMEGTQGKSVQPCLAEYEEKIKSLIKLAEENYDEVSWYVFSDHGMHDTTSSFDLAAMIDKLGLTYGSDYVAMYDSTMARFWYMNQDARDKIYSALRSCPKGHALTDKQLKEFGVFFPDRRYGQTIFLMNSGVLLSPSFMGRRPIPGMHGYHPYDADSAAMIMSNQPLPQDLRRIEQIFWLMVRETL